LIAKFTPSAKNIHRKPSSASTDATVPADVINVQLRIADATTEPVIEVANQVVPELIKKADELGLIPPTPDPKRPDTVVPYVAPSLPPIKKAIEKFCDHNPCPHL
jgi:hypothetical protein